MNPPPTATKRIIPGTIFGRIVVGLAMVFIALPLLWLAYSAFLPKEAVFNGEAIPKGFTLQNFIDLPYNELLRPLMLSLVLSSLVAFLQIVVALPAAYALRSGSPLIGLYLFFMAVPAELLLVPLYGVLKSMGLISPPENLKNLEVLTLILPFMASPLTVFLLFNGLQKIPWTYVEAAKLDGANNLTVLLRVITPLLLPEIVAAGVLGFAAHWNLVLYPKVMVGNQALWTVQVALSDLLNRRPNEWGILGAAALVTSLPILFLYLAFERRVTRTLEGGLK